MSCSDNDKDGYDYIERRNRELRQGKGSKKQLFVGQRVRHTQSGKLGVLVGQPNGDPHVILDDAEYSDIYYRSQITPSDEPVPDCIGPRQISADHCPVHTHHRTRRIYVASSWKNLLQPDVVNDLRGAGFEVYDFKNPEPAHGFSWSEVDLDSSGCSIEEYLTALERPRAVEGFTNDFNAMQWADTFVLVLPCGRSAHLELGWAVGAGKRTAIVMAEEPCTPELMYRMVDHLALRKSDLLQWAGIADA